MFDKRYFVKDLTKLEKYDFYRCWQDIYEKPIYQKEEKVVALLINQARRHDNEMNLYIGSDNEFDDIISLDVIGEIINTIKQMLEEGVLEER